MPFIRSCMRGRREEEEEEVKGYVRRPSARERDGGRKGRVSPTINLRLDLLSVWGIEFRINSRVM